MRRKKITEVQKNLLSRLKQILTPEKVLTYEEIKKEADFKSFDGTFNALLNKNYIRSTSGRTGKNTFELI